jgi:hypothetical protein
MMLDDCEIRRMSDLLDLGALLGDDLASDTKNDGADIDDINISYSPYSSGEENHIALGITWVYCSINEKSLTNQQARPT